MAEEYTLSLEAADVFQILDALESRAGIWSNTVEHARGTLVADGDTMIEAYRDEDEAVSILTHYQDIIKSINGQIEPQ